MLVHLRTKKKGAADLTNHGWVNHSDKCSCVLNIEGDIITAISKIMIILHLMALISNLFNMMLVRKK